MLPECLRPLFWDINPESFDPPAYPEYTIGRVLEFGDEDAIEWLTRTFPEKEIARIIRSERTLSRKSANFWALVYHIPREEVAALRQPE